MALEMETALYIKRVPTKDNLADDPSRERYDLLHRINVSNSSLTHTSFSHRSFEFELTGDNVTECTGGARGLTDDDLKDGYRSLVDPRLNYEQALEMAMLIANRLVPHH